MDRELTIQLVVDSSGAVTGLRRADGAVMRFEQQLRGTGKEADRFGSVMTAALAGVALAAVTKLAAGVVGASRRLFELGTAAEETASKFSTVFGDMAQRVETFGQDFANSAGMTQREFRDMASNVGAVLQGMGLGMQQTAEQTEQIVRLAADLASFHNTSIEESFAAIRSGLTGEQEPLKRYGIVLRAEMVDGATEAEKAVNRLAKITELAGVAVGDLSRTQDSTANRTREANAILREQVDLLAQELLPAIQDIVRTLSTELKENRGEIEAAVKQLAAFVNTTVQVVGDLIQATDAYFDNLTITIHSAAGLVEQFVSRVLGLLSALARGLATFSAVVSKGGLVPDLSGPLAGLASDLEGYQGLLEQVVQIRRATIGEILGGYGGGQGAAAPPAGGTGTPGGGTPGGGTPGGGTPGGGGAPASPGVAVQGEGDPLRQAIWLTEEMAAASRDLDAQLSQESGFDLRAESALRLVEGLQSEIDAEIRAAIATEEAEQRKREAMEETVKSTLAARDASIRSAADVANSVIQSVRQVVRAKIAESIAKAIASIPFPLNLVAGGAAAAGINLLFNRLIPEFEAGGYTGDLPPSAVAGVVHGREYVVNADATARYRPMLDAMNSGVRVPSPSAVAGAGATLDDGRIVQALESLAARMGRLEVQLSVRDVAEHLASFQAEQALIGNGGAGGAA